MARTARLRKASTCSSGCGPGEFEDGAKVLRAKIDMASPNINLRDPVLYRIRHATHHRTGDAWCIYPMYDYTHAISDAIEGITHSLCTLEFEDHRPLYDWCVDNLPVPHKPRQIEFARLNLNYTVMSKRKLLQLVQEGLVAGWDDPRMPTICGLRRRGYTPESIRDFAARIGMAKRENVVDVALLEDCVRDDLNKRARRALAVLRPLEVVIENYPEGQVEEIEISATTPRTRRGQRGRCRSRGCSTSSRTTSARRRRRSTSACRPGARCGCAAPTSSRATRRGEGRSRARWSSCAARYDPATRGGAAPDGRKVKATIHWVSAAHAVDAEVRLYDRLFTRATPGADEDARLQVVPQPALARGRCAAASSSRAWRAPAPRATFQFERLGYFCVDPRHHARAASCSTER